MKLYKDGLVKELTKEKTIARLLGDGWSQEDAVDNLISDSVAQPVIDQEPAVKKRRGRPAKVA